MAKFVDQGRFLILLREYQFRAYDRPEPGRGVSLRCQLEISTVIASRERVLKEREMPFEERPVSKGYKKERRTDETLDHMAGCMERYIEFKKKCLENHVKCLTNRKHRLMTDRELAPIENELGVIVTSMARECFRAWFAGYTNYYKDELISTGIAMFWDKLTKFNTEFSHPFSYYTQVLKQAMIGFISDYHRRKADTMSLSVFEDVNSA